MLLTIESGYATILWPPAGISLGMLLIYGRHLWPGVLIGAFVLNCCISEAASFSGGFVPDKTLGAFCIATGSTLQAFIACTLLSRYLGRPIRFESLKQVLAGFAIAAPLTCLIAASIGVGSLAVLELIPAQEVFTDWWTWWFGDMLGIAVFTPLLMVMPGTPNRLYWRGTPLGTLPALAFLVLLMPLGLTFYGWKLTSQSAHEQGQSQFESLAVESEKALLHRIDSYDNALLGGAGFFHGSEFVSRKEWRSYVETIDVRNNFPGINGIGWISPVQPEDLAHFIEQVRQDDAPRFKVHPPTKNRPLYIITYIEPEINNMAAIGLNIGFEDNRVAAANHARDTGKPTITKRIVLVQDNEKTPGFLLLHPLYEKNMPINTSSERQEAFLGWIYAPFIAKNFLHNMTRSQGEAMNLRIYDGAEENQDTLIYRSDGKSTPAGKSTHTIRKKLRVMEQEWLVVWESTGAFDRRSSSEEPMLILVGGLLFTVLLGLFLMVTLMRRVETIEAITGERKLALPFIIFIIVSVGAFALYTTLKEKELRHIHTLVEEEATKIELVLRTLTNEKLMALRRMAQRWEAAGGTPQAQWNEDAANYIQDIQGLRTVEWIDESYHVRWVLPYEGNEKAVGLNIAFDEPRKQALAGAAESNLSTLTPPLNLVQGYTAFIAYSPLHIEDKFDGFIAGIFSIEEFFGEATGGERSENYAMAVSYEGKNYYLNAPASSFIDSSWIATKTLQIYDKKWELKLAPRRDFIRSERTNLPEIVLVASLLASALLALTLRYILISRIHSIRLATSEETFRAAMEDASIGMALVRPDGHWLKVNKALCDMLGYSEEELLRNDFQSITHPDDLEQDIELVKKIISGEAKTYQLEKRYFHKNGIAIWALLNVSLVRNANGAPDYFIAQIQDITERKEVERIKSEFISIVSHELRTPMTSIRGSLGLILGAFSKDLPDKVKGLVDIAHNNCERLILLINDILDIDKIASGQMRFDMRPESVADATKQATQANEGYAQKFNTTINLEPIDETLRINIDIARYIQVLSNLLSNAIKFSPENVPVEVSTTVADDRVRIYVQDYGEGIPEEFRSRIFSKFSQADSSSTRNKGGTGLGLHITQQMVEYMGGEIGFDTEIGKGTAFWVDFPLYHEPVVQPLEELPPSDRRVLICEDGEDVAKIMQMMMAQDGFNSDIAPDLATARQLIAQVPYAVITLDSELPDGDGISFAQELYNDPETRDIPVVIVSGKQRSELAAGLSIPPNAGEWLVKPILQKTLSQALQNATSSRFRLPRILHVEDEVDFIDMLAAALHDKAEVVPATTIQQAHQLLEDGLYKMIILDIGMPDGDVGTLLDKLEKSTLPDTPVIVLSAEQAPEDILKRVDTSLVKARISEAKIIEIIIDKLEQSQKPEFPS